VLALSIPRVEGGDCPTTAAGVGGVQSRRRAKVLPLLLTDALR
jgi:hypothetical protein